MNANDRLRQEFLDLDAGRDSPRRLADVTCRWAVATFQQTVERGGGLVGFPLGELANALATFYAADADHHVTVRREGEF